MKTKPFVKKYVTKPLAIALTTGVICSPFAGRNADADSYLIISRDRDEAKVGAMFSVDIPFFGEGKGTKYNSRNENLESQVAGLASVPKISGESSQAYFEKYDGNWFTKPAKEIGHGMTSILHPYNTKTDGTKRYLPGVSTLTREGSVFAPITGLVAYAVNGVSKLLGKDFRMYNAWEKNGWRTAGTLVTAGVAIGSSGGGGSDGYVAPQQEEEKPETTKPKPKPEPVEEEPVVDEPEPEPPAPDSGGDV